MMSYQHTCTHRHTYMSHKINRFLAKDKPTEYILLNRVALPKLRCNVGADGWPSQPREEPLIDTLAAHKASQQELRETRARLQTAQIERSTVLSLALWPFPPPPKTDLPSLVVLVTIRAMDTCINVHVPRPHKETPGSTE